MNLRQRARQLFPNWSRTMRAKWVLAYREAQRKHVALQVQWNARIA